MGIEVFDESYQEPAEPVLGEVALEDEAKQKVDLKTQSPRQALETLKEAGLDLEAMKLLSQVLPNPLLVRWAYQCVDLLMDQEPSGKDRPCMDSVARWLEEPAEADRRAAQEAAEAAEYLTAPAWVAGALYFSGGSVAPEGNPEVPPPPTACAQSAVAAVTIACLSFGPSKPSEQAKRARHCLDKLWEMGQAQGKSGAKPPAGAR